MCFTTSVTSNTIKPILDISLYLYLSSKHVHIFITDPGLYLHLTVFIYQTAGV